ncbi:hypothetical protein [Tautonia rosea]|uniref:hypothetical protein n=1 Tax=Tautonia rosea TaxID=2728037 RepID=UPI001475834D|nr:hypothetical protein [Tautonia rosea]
MVDRADTLTPPAPRASWTIALVIAAQVAAITWLMVVPLPSIEAQRRDALARAEATGDPGGVTLQSLRRAYFLLAADEHLARAVANLSDPEHLGQRLPIVLTALLIAGSAVSLGDGVLRLLGLVRRLSPLARWPLAFVSGATLLAALTLGLGRMGGLEPLPVRIGLAGFLLVGIILWSRDLLHRRRNPSPSPSRSFSFGPIGLALILAPVLTLMALGAMQPTIEYDALEYHLQGPKEAFETGRIAFLSHNVYTSMPSAVEMLHLLGMLVLDDWWLGALAGQLLIASFAPVTAALIAATAWRWASGRSAWVAGLVYLTTPWVFRLATFPFVEGPLCSYHAALVFSAAMAWTTPREETGRSSPCWLFVGLLAGGAMACKYPGLVSAVVPFGLVAMGDAWRRRMWRLPVVFGLGVIIAVGPWLARNVADTGNPVFPLAYGVFGGSEWDADLDARWQNAHGPRPVTAAAFLSSTLDVIGRSDWHSPLYALLVPLALLRRKHRGLILALSAYVLYLFVTWFLLTHRLDRFWLPLLPAAAVLAGIGADWTRSKPWPAWLSVVLGLVTATNLVFLTTPLCGPIDWTADLNRLRREAMETATPSLARLDAALPDGSTTLVVGQAGVFSLRHPILYNTVFNRERLAEIVADRSAAEVAEELKRQTITHVYVDWSEIERHRKPGGYGYSPVVTRTLFEDLVSRRVLTPPVPMGPNHLLYRVVEPSDTSPEYDPSP